LEAVLSIYKQQG